MWSVIGFLSLVAALVFLVMGIVSIVRKKNNTKRNFMIGGIAFVVFIVAITASPNTKNEPLAAGSNSPSTSSSPAVTPDSSKEAADKKAADDAASKEKAALAKLKDQQDAAIAAKKAEEEAKKNAPKSFKGNSDQATQIFELSAGFAVIEASYTGNSNFIIEFMDESGGTKDLLVNEIGNYKGKTFALIPSDGKYLLNVTGQGNWNIKISQAKPANIDSAPVTFTGKGDDVVFVNLKSGLTKFTSEHSGQSNFVVMLNGSNLLVNEIGKYSGSTAQSLNDDGMYVISINADGKWSVKVEQ